jgi:hypothetical protein
LFYHRGAAATTTIRAALTGFPFTLPISTLSLSPARDVTSLISLRSVELLAAPRSAFTPRYALLPVPSSTAPHVLHFWATCFITFHHHLLCPHAPDDLGVCIIHRSPQHNQKCSSPLCLRLDRSNGETDAREIPPAATSPSIFHRLSRSLFFAQRDIRATFLSPDIPLLTNATGRSPHPCWRWSPTSLSAHVFQEHLATQPPYSLSSIFGVHSCVAQPLGRWMPKTTTT